MNNDEIKEKNSEEIIEEELKEESEAKVKPEVKEEPKNEKRTKKEVKNKYKEELAKKEIEVAELKNELLKNRAELENFKKRMAQEAAKDRKYASMNLVADIVTPLEYLQRACEFQSDDQALNNFLIGFKMISSQIVEVLKNDGLAEIECLGKEFDPNFCEAVEAVEVPGEEPNKVIAELSKGYKYKDRVLKVAKVKISK